ncbi:MAG TPA: NHLP bacteriocin export ABC transporter permease/ATPase subunit [Pirellula sp.]|nr:NHLP bacteriocin export ABC transporter permease/ATPase subunit [Pirellula sp.]
MNSQTIDIDSLRRVHGNGVLLLDDCTCAWRLLEGTVAIFAVRVRDQVPFGTRRYLFNCNQSDWLFNQESINEEHGFLAVGLEDSKLEKVNLIRAGVSDAVVPIEFALGIDAWVRRVGATVRGGSVQYAETASEGQEHFLSAGERLRAPVDTVLWVLTVSGRIRLLGEALESSVGWMPMCGVDCLTADIDSTVRLEQSVNIRSIDDMLVGLNRYHRLVFSQLNRQEQDEAVQNAQRLEVRKKNQQLDTEEVIRELGAVLFQRTLTESVEDPLFAALIPIGQKLGVRFRPLMRSGVNRSFDTEVESIARKARVRVRYVLLRGEWWKSDSGPILGRWIESGNPVSLLRGENSYVAIDPIAGTRQRVDRRRAKLLSREAVTFIPPLPDSANSLVTLCRFAIRPVASDMLIVVFLASAIMLLGMLVPISTGLIIDDAIPDANFTLLYQLSAGLLAMAIAQAALSLSQNNLLLRADTALTALLQASVIDRLLRLPGSFFRRFSSGDLLNRTMMVSQISREVSHTAVAGILIGCTAMLNFLMCFYYSSRLALVACLVAIVIASYTAVLSLVIRRMARKLTLGRGLLNGFQVQLISGVTKIQVAAAQQRAFNAWARKVSQQLRLSAAIQRAEHLGNLINTALQHAAMVVLYYFAANLLISGAESNDAGYTMLTMGTFLAFYAAFNKMITGATGASNTLVELSDSWAKKQFIVPLLEQAPEDSQDKVDPGRLQGAISVAHISFRYREDGPPILNDVTLHANPGQFVAIVGPSGSGKSTLLRILLGFEASFEGSVCFDGQDLAGLDSTIVRKQIGVVLQSGNVNSGSLFENIAGSSRVSLDQAWEAARAAGLAADIEQMPMGMHTFINEGGRTLSGGQRQRLLIARALVTRPKILIFDEATSSLDNRTQQIVSESLERMQVTRIVVAHRLSTIREANRIYVLQAGRIVQNGSYQELATKDGLFQRMIARQVV